MKTDREWGVETRDLLAVLVESGVSLRLENGKLEIQGRPSRALRELVAERYWDLVAWFSGDRATGVRRLDAKGTVMWRVTDPGGERQTEAER